MCGGGVGGGPGRVSAGRVGWGLKIAMQNVMRCDVHRVMEIVRSKREEDYFSSLVTPRAP